MRKIKWLFSLLSLLITFNVAAQTKSLHQLQQEFVDLRLGLFVHFGLPTFQEADWTDPDLSPEVFNPLKLDCNQWADAAESAHMKFVCFSAKHHAGFCMWDTKTTDYSVMSSPQHRDVIKELVEAFRKKNMQIMFHFSILDTHHRIRANLPFTREKIDMIKEQLRELLTNYGPINTIMFDGWDAPWGRITYEDISFPEIYHFVKSIQPNCLVMDLNGAKYPQEALFYSDIRCYEQGAGQKISAEVNKLPAMSCYPLQRTWFWKESFPTEELKSVETLVKENIIPYNNAYCTYILNSAPNRDGLMDENALNALKKLGEIWQNTGHLVDVPECESPIIENNIAINRPCESSWSDDMMIMDFANDDNFSTAWDSSPFVKNPFWEVSLKENSAISMVVITEAKAGCLQKYSLEYELNGKWNKLFEGEAPNQNKVKIHRFDTVHADKVRINIQESNGNPQIVEFGVYEPYQK